MGQARFDQLGSDFRSAFDTHQDHERDISVREAREVNARTLYRTAGDDGQPWTLRGG